MAEVDRVQLRVIGRVQGVGFRYFVQTRATSLGLRGWVRNESDGSVLLLAEGDPDSLARLLKAVGVGPRGARVDHTVTEPVTDSSPLRPFEVRYSEW